MTNNSANPHNGVCKQEIAARTFRTRADAERCHREAAGRLGGLPALRYQLVKVFGRIDRLACQIDEAFAGQPFLPNLSAPRQIDDALMHMSRGKGK